MNVMSLAVLVILALLGQCFGRPEIDPDNNGMTSTEDTGLSFEEYLTNEGFGTPEDQHTDRSEVKKPFSIAMSCATQERVFCHFQITNNDNRDLYLLKHHTPLMGYMSNFLKVTRDGKEVQYDGMLIHYLLSRDSFVSVKPGETLSATLDVTTTYSFNEPGEYTIRYDQDISYMQNMNNENLSTNNIEQQGEQNITVTIHKMRTVLLRTEGEMVRDEEKQRLPFAGTQQETGTPKKPAYVNFPADKKKLFSQVHNTAYFYINMAIDEVSKQSGRFTKWFGKPYVASRFLNMRNLYKKLKESMEKERTVFEYNTPQYLLNQCDSRTLALIPFRSRVIYICPIAFDFDPIASKFSLLNTVVHELSHLYLKTIDDKNSYGPTGASLLAKTDPKRAINNAANHAYFITYIMPINYGVDSIAVHGSYTYVTTGPVYIRYSDEGAFTVDCGYPKLIYDNWGPPSKGSLKDGFHSMLVISGDNRIYVTKGDKYWRYNSETDKNPVGPLPIGTSFSQSGLPHPFKTGFDSHFKLNNVGKYYATRGNQFLRYSGIGAHFIDNGYPKLLTEYWRGLDQNFDKFSGASVLRNGRFYAFNEDNYVRYTGRVDTGMDQGYPQKIKDNWGKYVPCDD